MASDIIKTFKAVIVKYDLASGDNKAAQFLDIKEFRTHEKVIRLEFGLKATLGLLDKIRRVLGW